MVCTVRTTTPADAEIIVQHRYPDDADAPECLIYAEWVRGALGGGKYVGLLAVDGSTVVAGAGLALLDWWPTRADPSPLRARLVNVWTHSDHRRQGLARRLALALLNEAKARGIRTVSLSSTEMGRPLYESLGFKAYPSEMLLTMDGSA
jgi:GNAT superfamily N-acetyltransferase